MDVRGACTYLRNQTLSLVEMNTLMTYGFTLQG
jgi:hypothetical protein